MVEKHLGTDRNLFLVGGWSGTLWSEIMLQNFWYPIIRGVVGINEQVEVLVFVIGLIGKENYSLSDHSEADEDVVINDRKSIIEDVYHFP